MFHLQQRIDEKWIKNLCQFRLAFGELLWVSEEYKAQRNGYFLTFRKNILVFFVGFLLFLSWGLYAFLIEGKHFAWLSIPLYQLYAMWLLTRNPYHFIYQYNYGLVINTIRKTMKLQLNTPIKIDFEDVKKIDHNLHESSITIHKKGSKFGSHHIFVSENTANKIKKQFSDYSKLSLVEKRKIHFIH